VGRLPATKALHHQVGGFEGRGTQRPAPRWTSGGLRGRQTATPSRPTRRSDRDQKPPAAITARTCRSWWANLGSWRSPSPRAARARKTRSSLRAWPGRRSSSARARSGCVPL
jgi:hypothetical protein